MAMHRIEVRPTLATGSLDPRGEDALHKAQAAGIAAIPTSIDSTAVYLIEGDLDERSASRLANEILCDGVTET
ncbi:MAG: hypothetical protein HOC93_03295, partial [Phycisphaerae bacterium]|nr:hypothetical protein [Phycisphaerae bacterium]